MYKLFLDDERHPQQVKWIEMPLGPWVIVRSYNEFVKIIKERGLPSFISFDHDLSFEHYPIARPDGGIGLLKEKINYDTYAEKTGYHCAKWLVDFCLDKNLKLPSCQCHSMNPVGKQNILRLLQQFRRFQNASRPSPST